jgi:formiminoglutamase
MDVKIFFSRVNEKIYSDIESNHSFFKNIFLPGPSFPDVKKADIALIGLEESRGSSLNEKASQAPDVIRKKLYRLKKGMNRYKIVDLGNIRNGHSLEETNLRIKEVCRFLIDNDVFPLLFGGTHDLDYGLYQAYEDMEKLVTVLNVDAFIDLGFDEKKDKSHSHVNNILTHQPNYLFNYSHIGYQSYLIDPESLAMMEKLYFDTYRIGKLRQNISEMEPTIRDADMLSFDITAIKSSDAPGNAMAQPFGLSGEEACQLCWYAGLNEKMTSAGFFEYNPELDMHDQKTASVIATMMWYFIEGFYHRKDHFSFKSNYYLKYVVSMPDDPDALIFYKSKLSEKWWIEVPYPNGKKVFDRNSIVPCSYVDYQKAMQGEIPERWIHTQARLL